MHLVRVPNPLPQDLPKSDGEPVYLSSCIWWSNPLFTQIQCFNWFSKFSFSQWATSCVDQKQPVIRSTSWPVSLRIRVSGSISNTCIIINNIQRCPILIPHATHPDHLPKFLDQSGSTGLAADLLAKPGCGHYIIWVISETLFAALFTLRTSSPVAIIRCRCQLKRGE